MAAICKHCGASIIWASTHTGRRLPLDERALPRNAPAGWVLDGGIARPANPSRDHSAMPRYRHHWTTCSHAHLLADGSVAVAGRPVERSLRAVPAVRATPTGRRDRLTTRPVTTAREDPFVTEIHLDLDWWPPSPNEPIGEERARELVEALRKSVGPVLEAAEADLRQRANPGTEIVRGGAPASYFARLRFEPEMQSLCVGTVYEGSSGDPDSNSIQLLRDGRLTWRRD